MGNFIAVQRAKMFGHYARDYAESTGERLRLLEEDYLAQQHEIEASILSKLLISFNFDGAAAILLKSWSF